MWSVAYVKMPFFSGTAIDRLILAHNYTHKKSIAPQKQKGASPFASSAR
jgi:hypothetical protein